MYKSIIIFPKVDYPQVDHVATFNLTESKGIMLDCSCGWNWVWFSYAKMAKQEDYFNNAEKIASAHINFVKYHILKDLPYYIDFESGNKILENIIL